MVVWRKGCSIHMERALVWEYIFIAADGEEQYSRHSVDA